MDRTGIEQLRVHVLHLHKLLVDAEREVLERLEGRLTGHQFLERLLHDEAYAWLKLMSAVIIGFDEWLDDAEAAPAAADAYVDELRRILNPDPAGDHFQRRYADLLQQRPEVVMAHARVAAALR